MAKIASSNLAGPMACLRADLARTAAVPFLARTGKTGPPITAPVGIVKGTVVLVFASSLVALLAGASVLPDGAPGAAPAPEQSAAVLVRPAPSPVFGGAVTVAGPVASGEPGIAIDGDGRIFVVAPEGGQYTRMWRSDDGGGTFHEVAHSLGASGDSDIAIDDAGTVYVNDLLDKVPVSTSLDHGATFARVLDAAPDSAITDRQWLASAGTGTVYATWREGFSPGEYRISISHDSARTWTHQEMLVASGLTIGGPLLVAPDGSLHAALSTLGGVDHVRSDDGGLTWTRNTVAQRPGKSTVGIFPVVAVDVSDNVYVAWGESDTIEHSASWNPTVMLATSHDGGATFGAPVQMSTPGHYGVFPWLLAGSEGRVDLFWLDGVPALPAGTGVPEVGEQHRWYLRMAQSLDAHKPNPTYRTVLVTPDVVHTGSLCADNCLASGVVSAPSALNDRRILDFFEATLDEDGNALVTWAKSPEPTDPAFAERNEVYLRFAKQVGGRTLR